MNIFQYGWNIPLIWKGKLLFALQINLNCDWCQNLLHLFAETEPTNLW